MLLLLLLLCCPSAVYLFGVFFCCFSTPLHSSSIRSKVLSFLFRSTFLIFFISLAAYSVALRAYSHVDTNQERESAQSLLHMYTLKTIPYTLYYNRMIFRQLFFFSFYVRYIHFWLSDSFITCSYTLPSMLPLPLVRCVAL